MFDFGHLFTQNIWANTTRYYYTFLLHATATCYYFTLLLHTSTKCYYYTLLIHSTYAHNRNTGLLQHANTTHYD